MTSKDKKLKIALEYVFLLGRIEELKASKSWLGNSDYYRRRLTSLEDKVSRLEDKIESKDDVEEIKLTFHVSEELLKGDRTPDKVLQFLKREYLIEK